jgi:hypothetical protein
MADAAPIDSLLDILELIERIERQTGGLTREAFLLELQPDLTVAKFIACATPFIPPELTASYADGFRKAGLPEEWARLSAQQVRHP